MNCRFMPGRVLVLALSVLTICLSMSVGRVAVAAAPEVRVTIEPNLIAAGHVSIAVKKGYFKSVGLNVNLFANTAQDGGQAMIDGRVDIGFQGQKSIAGFPPRISAKVFLISSIDCGDSMILAWPESGIRTLKDLKGKTVATVRYSTAYILLVLALESVGLDIRSDVKTANMTFSARGDMMSAVQAFIAHEVDVIATCRPFDVDIRRSVPNAVLLTDERAFFPNYAIVAGFAVQGRYLRENRDAVKRFTKAWMLANDFLVQNKEESCRIVSEFANTSYEAELASYEVTRFLPSKEWVAYYRDGSVARWIGKTEAIQIWAGVASVRTYKDPLEWVDSTLYPEVFEFGLTQEKAAVADIYLYAGLAGTFLAIAAIGSLVHVRNRKMTRRFES